MKAAFLFKFGSFVDWPVGAFPGTASPFVIGVYGDEAIAAELELVTRGRDVEGRPVQVLRLKDGDDGTGAHILYAGGPREARAREVLAKARGAVLTVGEEPLPARIGPVLYFTQEHGRVRFVASLAAAAAHGLRLNAKLLAVAQTVEGR